MFRVLLNGQSTAYLVKKYSTSYDECLAVVVKTRVISTGTGTGIRTGINWALSYLLYQSNLPLLSPHHLIYVL